MIGKVLEFDDTYKVGYILGYDSITYIFRQTSIKNNTELKKDDAVEFDCLLNEEMPEAVRVEKRKK